MTPLWEHQKRGVDLIDQQTATLLHWEMGTGKSRTIVEWVRRQPKGSRILIVCPNSVVDVWPLEFDKHAPSSPIAVYPMSKERSSDTLAKRIDRGMRRMSHTCAHGNTCVLVINYEALAHKPADTLLKPRWDAVVADEIHRIKSPGGKQSRFCAKLRDRATKRIGLTGTPLPHSLEDAYAQFRFLDPAIYGTSKMAFQRQYCILQPKIIGRNRFNEVTGYKNTDDFHRRFMSISDQVHKRDVLDLPEQLHVERWVDINADTRAVYEDLEKHLIAGLEQGVVTAANAMVKTLRLRQITSGHVHTEDDRFITIDHAKEDMLVDILSDIEPDKPVVVFGGFRLDLDAAERAAKKLDRPYYELSGRRKDFTARWEPDGGGVAGVQIQAGGTGIDLTAAATAIYYSQTWSLGEYDQSLARLHRPGQRHNVTYYHLLARNTIDYAVRRALVNRQNMVEALLAGFSLDSATKGEHA